MVKVVAGFWVAEDAAHAAEEVKVFGEAGGGEEEEEFDGFGVGGLPGDAVVVATEDDDWFFEDVAHGVAGVGKSEGVADCGGVHFFAVDEGLPEGDLFGGLTVEFGDEADELAQGVVARLALQMQVDSPGIEIGGNAHWSIIGRVGWAVGKNPERRNSARTPERFRVFGGNICGSTCCVRNIDSSNLFGYVGARDSICAVRLAIRGAAFRRAFYHRHLQFGTLSHATERDDEG